MSNKPGWYSLLLIGLVLLLGSSVVGCTQAPASIPAPSEPALTPMPNPRYVYENGAIEVGGDGEPIELINNPDATNPTYAELLAFIKRDRTDEYSYIFGPPKIAYVCSDFAEDVHNNAEAAGIKAAWVGIDIDGKTEGHALNAFQTTDIGLVYIDCTGKGLWDELSGCRSWDRRAYVKVGESYGVADIDKAKTCFMFDISTPCGYDGGCYKHEEKPKEQTLKRLEELGWIGADTYEERRQKSLEQEEWLQSHNVHVLRQRWMEEWIRKYEAELSRCGWEFIPWSYCGDFDGTPSYSAIQINCLETPWFQPKEELREVDGIPIVWRIWQRSRWIIWVKRLGVVKDIHIHW